jgi:hypothetical protein
MGYYCEHESRPVPALCMPRRPAVPLTPPHSLPDSALFCTFCTLLQKSEAHPLPFQPLPAFLQNHPGVASRASFQLRRFLQTFQPSNLPTFKRPNSSIRNTYRISACKSFIRNTYKKQGEGAGGGCPARTSAFPGATSARPRFSTRCRTPRRLCLARAECRRSFLSSR